MKYNWKKSIPMSKHEEVYQRIESVLEEENDWIAAMATVACELHNSFNHFHWTGFYRTVAPNLLKMDHIKEVMDV